jgi:hypothetical protein
MGPFAKPTRETRTITIDFHDETTSFALLGNTQAFVECVLAFVLSIGFQLKHQATIAVHLRIFWLASLYLANPKFPVIPEFRDSLCGLRTV